MRRLLHAASALLLAAAIALPAWAQAPDAAALYAAQCASCHGADRFGGTGPALLPENLERLRKPAAADTIANGRLARGVGRAEEMHESDEAGVCRKPLGDDAPVTAHQHDVLARKSIAAMAGENDHRSAEIAQFLGRDGREQVAPAGRAAPVVEALAERSEPRHLGRSAVHEMEPVATHHENKCRTPTLSMQGLMRHCGLTSTK